MKTLIIMLFTALFFACGNETTTEEIEIQTCGEEKLICNDWEYCGIDKYNKTNCVPFSGRCNSLTDCEPMNFYYCDYETKYCKKRGNDD